jgi:hypothetical protein
VQELKVSWHFAVIQLAGLLLVGLQPMAALIMPTN